MSQELAALWLVQYRGLRHAGGPPPKHVLLRRLPDFARNICKECRVSRGSFPETQSHERHYETCRARLRSETGRHTYLTCHHAECNIAGFCCRILSFSSCLRCCWKVLPHLFAAVGALRPKAAARPLSSPHFRYFFAGAFWAVHPSPLTQTGSPLWHFIVPMWVFFVDGWVRVGDAVPGRQGFPSWHVHFAALHDNWSSPR